MYHVTTFALTKERSAARRSAIHLPRLLVWVVPCGKARVGIIRCSPEVVSRESSPLPLRRAFVKERERVRTGHKFVGNWTLYPVAFLWIDDLPVVC